MATNPNQCPRCSQPVTAVPDEQGYVTCAGCGSRLRSRASLKAPVAVAVAPPTSAVPPQPAPIPGAPPLVVPDERPPFSVASTPTLSPPVSPAIAPPPTLPYGASLPPAFPAVAPAGLDVILAEIRALRQLQVEILELLRSQRAAPPPAPSIRNEEEDEDDQPAVLPPLRSERRKTVLLLDDDPESRQVAAAALERALVPVRIAEDGNAGLAAIAAEKPDIIILELELGGAMAGKDVINMIKATMEWVDIPIVLYTRLPIQSQKEARTVHGADEYVVKGPAGHEVLVSKIVTLFRRG